MGVVFQTTGEPENKTIYQKSQLQKKDECLSACI